MSKFKVGDYIVSKAPKSTYCTTSEGWVGRVTSEGGVISAKMVKLLPCYDGTALHVMSQRVPGSLVNKLDEKYFDLCDKDGNLITGVSAVTTYKFKVGDLVTGGPGNTYGVTTGKFVGEVMTLVDKWMDVKVLKTDGGRIIDPVRESTYSGPHYVEMIKFVPYTGVRPGVKAVETMTTSKQPQAFMQGVDVHIERLEGYYDINTDDYAGKCGNISKYLSYSESDGCWLVSLLMHDGETLDVLESELVGYAALSGKKTKPKAVKTFAPTTPVTYAPPGKAESKRVVARDATDYYPKKEVGSPSISKGPKTTFTKTGEEIYSIDRKKLRKKVPKIVF